MTSAYAYLRVSGRSQIEGDGFPRQLTAIQTYCRSNKIKLVKTYREEGISGKHELENRPALSQLASTHARATTIILIERLDRLARDLMVQETILGDLRKHGYEVVSVTEPELLSDDPSRKLMRQVFGAIAEYDRVMTVAKLKAAKDRASLTLGRRIEGRKPYGTRRGEKAVIEAMRALRSSGLGWLATANTLNADGHRTRMKKKWIASTVRRILLRETKR